MFVSCKRGAHFQKFVFFMLGLTFSRFCNVLECFGDPFWGAKVEPKWLRNSIKKWSDFWIALGRALGRQSGFHPATIGPSWFHGEPPLYCRVNPSGQVVQNSRVWARLAFLCLFMSCFAYRFLVLAEVILALILS